MSEPTVCAACPVDVGVCPHCDTFWYYEGGKHYGMQPVLYPDRSTSRAKDARLWHPDPRIRVPNMVQRP